MYDIIVIGSGISSLFFLHSLKNSDLKILVLEKGDELDKRSCHKAQTIECKCRVCSRHYGVGGPFRHEGKFNYTNDFGGDLGAKIGDNLSLRLQRQVDDILMSYCDNDVDLYSTDNDVINQKAKKANLEVLTTIVRHLGVDNTYQIFNKLYKDLKADFKFNVEEINIVQNDSYFEVNGISAKKVVVATNRCNLKDLEKGPARVDFGLRVEMLTSQWDSVLKETFETKLKDQDSYTYCMNPHGRIIPKVHNGFIYADGQNFKEQNQSSNNLNFTFFVPAYFNTQQEADVYTKDLMNNLGNQINVQKLCDLKNNELTKILDDNLVTPTIEAKIDNLNNIIPSRYISKLLAFLDKLEILLEQKIADDTLIYAIDAKYYAPIIKTDFKFQTTIDNLYVIGDCSGATSSLAQAAASGLYLGDIFKCDK